MQYKNETEKPLQPDQQAADRFVDWYAGELNTEATLIERPDATQKRQNGKAVDGVYSLGAIRLVVEHTTFDELPDKRYHDAGFRSIEKRFHDMKPIESRIYSLSLPYGYPSDYPMREQAQKIGDALSTWFQQNEAQITEMVQLFSVDGCAKVLRASALDAPNGVGKTYWGRYLEDEPTETDAEEPVEATVTKPTEAEVFARLENAVGSKLPKLKEHVIEPPAVRLLLLENNEMWRAHKTVYAQPVIDYMKKHLDQQCDEVWIMHDWNEYIEHVLLWSSQLDLPEYKNPFFDEVASLGELLENRHEAWRESHRK